MDLSKQISQFLQQEVSTPEEKIDSINKHIESIEINNTLKAYRQKQTESRSNSTKKIKFPYDSFPLKVQKYLNKYYNTTKLPKEYYYAYFLAGISTVIGNKIKLYYKNKYIQSAMIYMAIVGPPSLGKTPVMNRMFDWIFNKESNNIALYLELKKSQLENNENNYKEPEVKETIIEDVNIEYVAKALSSNPQGVVLLRDELAGWIKSFDQYKKNSNGDVSTYLELWNNPPLKKIGRIKGRIILRHPFITIVGNVQPELLKYFSSKEKTENGFLSRFLFVLLESTKKEKIQDISPSLDVVEAISNIYQYIDDIPQNIPPDESLNNSPYYSYFIRLSYQARLHYNSYIEENRLKFNEAFFSQEQGLYGKNDMYVLRFALIFEVMRRAANNATVFTNSDYAKCDGSSFDCPIDSWEVSEESMIGAIKLGRYFINTALSVLSTSQDPLAELSPTHRDIYESLNHEFTTKTVREVAKKIKMSTSTYKRFLNDRRYFKSLGRGFWQKRYI